MSADLVVVGGGPTGLAAALAAARAGRSVRLLERSDRLGGMAASIDVAGQRVDLGSHRLHPSAPARVRALLDELLGDDLQRRERNGRVRLGGRWARFPFRPADLVRSVPPRLAAGLARDILSRSGPSPDSRTYGDVITSGLGPTALAAFHGPMASKLWGRSPDDLAAELAHRRVSVADRRSVVRRLARTSMSSGREFLYPRLGYGQIVERLADAAVEAGADIRTETAWGHADRDTPTVWTAPVTHLAELLNGPPTGLDHRGLVLVYLTVDAPRWTEFDAHYVPDGDVAFARLSEPKNYRDGPDPADRTVVCAELPASVGDGVWTSDDGTLRDLVLDGIDRCRLPVPVIDGVESVRLPAVYPVIRADAPDARSELLAWADTLDGITVVGRQGLAVADNLHHVLDMTLSFVDHLGDDGTPDPAAWRRERARFERFVVDD